MLQMCAYCFGTNYYLLQIRHQDIATTYSAVIEHVKKFKSVGSRLRQIAHSSTAAVFSWRVIIENILNEQKRNKNIFMVSLSESFKEIRNCWIRSTDRSRNFLLKIFERPNSNHTISFVLNVPITVNSSKVEVHNAQGLFAPTLTFDLRKMFVG